jgi:uncharacterized RDD family membrane protein YckC
MSAAAETAGVPPAAPSLKGKRFLIRAMAYLIDMAFMTALAMLGAFVAGVLLMIPAIAVGLIIGREPYFAEINSAVLDLLFGAALVVLYFAFFEWLFGRSLGKLVLAMRVVREDGSPLSFRTALVRSLYRLLDGIGFGLVAWMHMKRPLYQRLGDKQTKTIVLSSRISIIQGTYPWWRFFVAAGLFLGSVIILFGFIFVFCIGFK